MEGKALLFKYLGGVDAVALCLGLRMRVSFVRAAQLLEPSFCAINLEDIVQPRCFRLSEQLRRTIKIPAWHDDQQGSWSRKEHKDRVRIGHFFDERERP